MTVVFTQMESFDARAENMDVEFISQRIVELHPQMDLQCVGPLIQDLITVGIRCISSGGGDFWSCFLQELPTPIVAFLKCQFKFSTEKAQAAALPCILALIGALLSGTDFTTVLSNFFKCLASQDGGNDDDDDDDDNGGGNGGGGNGGGGNGGGAQNRKVDRC